VSLAGRLAERIRSAGPVSVAEYMHLCLHDPRDGYYAVRPAIRADGDFITAPMVSQIFGELIGLWMIEVWRQMGRPDPVRLVELGPGDGTLMSDLLRAARLEPDFAAAIDLWLVEPSRPLRIQQVQKLGTLARHADSLDEVPKGAPLLVVANEVSLGIGRKGRFAGATEAKEEGRVAFRTDVSGAMHAQNSGFG
jgi:SAM-dependent MidA family methyltransferase